MIVQFGPKQVNLSNPHVMGILNVTPDSFYDGGRYFRSGNDISSALRQAESMSKAGATFLDIGGESTRPGAETVTLQEEMDRVLPVVEAINGNIDIVISVDTSSPEVMNESAKLGAGLINDVRALERPGAVDVVAKCQLPVCLMHMQGQPHNMQDNPSYEDPVNDVDEYFSGRVTVCQRAGIAEAGIILDPGFGFGKRDEHNRLLLKNLKTLSQGKFPILVGLSRKSILGRLLGRETQDRLAGSLALANHALNYGANILRVHDVPETVDVVKMFQFMSEEKQ